MGERAVATAQARFASSVMTEKTLDLYNSVGTERRYSMQQNHWLRRRHRPTRPRPVVFQMAEIPVSQKLFRPDLGANTAPSAADLLITVKECLTPSKILVHRLGSLGVLHYSTPMLPFSAANFSVSRNYPSHQFSRIAKGRPCDDSPGWYRGSLMEPLPTRWPPEMYRN